MRIGIAQINTVPGAFDETVERMVVQSQRAAEQGVDLLVFPLATLAGVDMVPPADEYSFMWDASGALADLSERLACDAIISIPCEVQRGGDLDFDVQLFSGNEMRSLCLDGDIETRNKHAMHDVFEFTYAGKKMAIAFTYAALDELDDYRYDCDVVIFLSGYSYAQDDPSSAMGADLANARFEDDADLTGAWIVGASSVGGYGDQVFSGSSFIFDSVGRLVALAPAFEEALITAELVNVTEEGHPRVVTPDLFDAPFHLWQAIVVGIRDFATKQGFEDVTLCLDGTLDSSVLLALASDAMGPHHVHALVGASAGAQAAGCRELAGRLRVDVRNADGPMRGGDPHDSDELELAALTRELDALALCSLDKTALALGIGCAGVHAEAFCPLGDVYRSDVLDMARVRNTISPLFRSVGLGEVDAIDLELSNGETYHVAIEQELTVVDEILVGHVEYAKSYSGLVRDMPDEAELAGAILRRRRSSELLRRTMPPVLAMSTNTLDEASFPLGLRWQDTHADLESELSDAFVSMTGGVPTSAADRDGSKFRDEDERKLRDARDGRSERAKGRVHMVPPDHPDVEATLAMLRDIMEQGGFAPSGLDGFLSSRADDGKGPRGNQAGAWITPFSEN